MRDGRGKRAELAITSGLQPEYIIFPLRKRRVEYGDLGAELVCECELSVSDLVLAPRLGPVVGFEELERKQIERGHSQGQVLANLSNFPHPVGQDEDDIREDNKERVEFGSLFQVLDGKEQVKESHIDRDLQSKP